MQHFTVLYPFDPLSICDKNTSEKSCPNSGLASFHSRDSFRHRFFDHHHTVAIAASVSGEILVNQHYWKKRLLWSGCSLIFDLYKPAYVPPSSLYVGLTHHHLSRAWYRVWRSIPVTFPPPHSSFWACFRSGLRFYFPLTENRDPFQTEPFSPSSRDIFSL